MYGVNGLALTSSLNMAVYNFLLWWVLYKRNLKLVSSRIKTGVINLLFLEGIAVLILWIIKQNQMLNPIALLFLSLFILGILSIPMLSDLYFSTGKEALGEFAASEEQKQKRMELEEPA
jgi:peptidoglycan biosynthesis protein MviN/MurJ (putative lipid II flippase)